MNAQADAALERILGARDNTTAESADLHERIPALLLEGQRALEERWFDAALEAFDAVLAIDQQNTEATEGRNRASVGQRILGRAVAAEGSLRCN